MSNKILCSTEILTREPQQTDYGYKGAITIEGSAIVASGELDEARLEQVAAVVQQRGGT